METIYFDTCALNRLSDDQSQARVRDEAEAVEDILRLVASSDVSWIASSVLRVELSRNPDPVHRDDSLDLLELASASVVPTVITIRRASVLRSEGLGEFDALHLAIAEEHRLNVLFTVDDRFLRRALKLTKAPTLLIQNPLDWLQGRKPWLIKR